MTRTNAHLDAMLRHLGAASYESLRDYSKGCGLCAAECPCGAVEMEPEPS
jgi:Pyruvate/2-oxoacid:ferredoxin oxidoreductase delta subunit